MSLKNLSDLNETEFKTFMDSFDNILCDCDGVIWELNELFDGIKETIDKLQKYGKKINFVTNNCILNREMFAAIFKLHNFNISADDLINPTSSIIDYLKSQNFNKDIFLIGTSGMKKDFTEAGYNVVQTKVVELTESKDIIADLVAASKSIGAVVVDLDLNTNYMKLNQAATLLRNPEVHFLGGATELTLIRKSADMVFIGPGYFQKMLEDISKRKLETFGKPSENLNKYVMHKFEIKNPARTLFIGDTLDQDIVFANKFGYQNILVLTGHTNMEMAENAAKDDIKVEFYLNSLGDLHKLMKEKLNF